VADEHRFVIAYPMSWRARGFWRYPEPDGPGSGPRYLRATLDAVARTQCVDPGRVLVTGISSGGRMTYAAGCELADRLLAIAPVSGGTRALPPCRPARPISIFDTHGTSDQIVSYRGRGADHDGRVRDVMDAWARRRGLPPAPAGAAHRPLRHAPGLAGVPRRRAGGAPAHLGRPARLAAARRPAGHRHRRRRGDLALLRGAAGPVARATGARTSPRETRVAAPRPRPLTPATPRGRAPRREALREPAGRGARPAPPPQRRRLRACPRGKGSFG
jgi:hypothetical protein